VPSSPQGPVAADAARPDPTNPLGHLSVVICTRNRPDKIGQAVASVLACEHPDFDVTVVDQSTTDATGEVLAPIVERDPRLRYHRVDEVGLSRAYNTGVRLTDGDVIAFTDDDCLVPSDWLTTITAALAAEPDADLLYGRVTPLMTDAEPGLTPYLDITKPARLSRHDGFRVFGMGANFAARRRLFDAIGGFDEVLGGGGPLRSSQDFDLAYRAYRAGHVITLRPEVWLQHDGRREAEDWPTLLRNYGVGDGAFYSKHVRCRDPYAAWLLARKVVEGGSKRLLKRAIGRAHGRDEYTRGVVQGVREGLRFTVDRDDRLYGEPRQASTPA
jgi:glycosyltransferase involved in cell wall biosynthesis